MGIQVEVPSVEGNKPRGRILDQLSPTARLKQRSVGGAAISVSVQGVMLVVQMGATFALARLLTPEDFGLQGMVVAMTGFLNLFRDGGLGVASIQREDLTHEQASTLFWINALIALGLTALAMSMAPVLVKLYDEPRLFAVTVASACAFLFYGLSVQHRALLNRAMRFGRMATVDVLATAASAAVGLTMALTGWGYWSLVGMAVTRPLATVPLVWIAMPWMPGAPSRTAGVRSMVNFGSILTLNFVVVYIAYNVEKVLLGRFWGAEALGLYGRAYQLANLPVDQLYGAIGLVAYPALSRVQSDGARVRRSFLEAYSVIVAVMFPFTVALVVFPEEIVRVLLGPHWGASAGVLRLLAPMVFVLTLINPFGWLLQATGRAARSLYMALMIAPVVILGVVVGVQRGPIGVALGYSTAMLALLVPCVAWAKRGTQITTADYWNTIKRPFLSAMAGGAAGWVMKSTLVGTMSPFFVLLIGYAVAIAVYAWVLLVVMKQKDRYVDMARHLTRRREESAVAAE
jgi:O-antigen/teichoic acid export membrane protein